MTNFIYSQMIPNEREILFKASLMSFLSSTLSDFSKFLMKF